MQKLKAILKKDMPRWAFWLLAALVVAGKLALADHQYVYTWVDGAPVDEELMFEAAQNITAGQWLGPYNWLTLSKNMFFAVWLAALHAVGIPYLLGGQLLWCAASLAASLAFAPVLRRYKSRFLLFALLACNPAASASYTLRVYRDNIFPALCVLCLAGFIGYALRYTAPLRRGLGWLGLAGLGLGLAWITREDGMWLMPFAVAAVAIVAVSVLRRPGLRHKAGRCAALALPFGVLAGCITAMCAANQAWYGLFALSDFSEGPFAAAFGAMTRVEHERWEPLVSVPKDVRAQLYEHVEELRPLEYWLEEYQPLQNAWMDASLGDYRTGSMYWALRQAAQQEGVYDTAQTAATYWQTVADKINALCADGTLAAALGPRSSTTAPIRPQYVGAVLAEGLHGLWYSATFQDCAPYYADRLTIGPLDALEEWHSYLKCRTNYAAVEGTSTPYYGPIDKLLYGVFGAVRWVYALVLPLALAAAAALQVRRGWRMLRTKRGEGLLLWLVLLGVAGMALLRCFMIAFVEVSSFGIGTYVMYLSTVHPLLILYAGAGILTEWKQNCPAC